MKPIHEAIQGKTGICWYRSGNPESEHALVLLHGLSSNASRWREFCRNAGRDSQLEGWKILTPDLRGHGGSPRHGGVNIETWLEDFREMLDHEQVRSLIVGGHCMGANLALHIAATRPAGLAGLVLIEPMVPEAWAGFAARFGRFRFILPPMAMLARTINRLGIGRGHFPELDLEQSDIQARRDSLAAGGDFVADYASPFRDLRYMPTASYLAALYQTLRPVPRPEIITCPALALLSAGGLFGDPVTTRAWLERIARVEIAELDAQHWIPTEQPDAMRAQIIDFAHHMHQNNRSHDLARY